MELIDLKADIRTKTGNGPARELRRGGKIPAVLYGPGREPVSLSIVSADFDKMMKASGASQPLFRLEIEGAGETKPSAMLKEIQRHPVSGNLIHADFYEIAMDRKIRVPVTVTTTGNSVGVEMGGMLQIIRHELEVLCLPLEIPDSIVIDVTNLDIGDSVHVKDIRLEGDIEIPAEVNFTVLTVLSSKKDTAGAAEGDEGDADLAEGDKDSGADTAD